MDAPAKSFVLRVKGHNAYFGCTKCTVEGEFLNNRMCYPNLNSSLRTDENFRKKKYDDFQLDETPLLCLNIDIIKSFPLDYMHLVCLGVMKRLLLFWVKGNMGVRMTNVDIVIVNNELKRFRKVICSQDFSRLPRSLVELDRWKACELRQFLLYSGPLVLINRLKHSQYLHFLTLHCAIRILCTPNLCKKYNAYAKNLLHYFVNNYRNLYGIEYVTHNVHNLIHLADDVLTYGPLDNFSAFKFENYMSKIKTMLKSSNYPLQQFVNRLQEIRTYSYKYLTVNKSYELKKELTVYCESLLDNTLVKSYELLCFPSFILGVGLKNNHFVTTKGVIMKVLHIIESITTKKVFMICNRYEIFENYFESPCDSKLFFCGKPKNVSTHREIVCLEEVLTKVIIFKDICLSYIHQTSKIQV